MLTACGECVGKQAAETRRGMQGTRQYQSLVLFKMQPQEGDEVLIPGFPIGCTVGHDSGSNLLISHNTKGSTLEINVKGEELWVA